jgi:hypothetical protein
MADLSPYESAYGITLVVYLAGPMPNGESVKLSLYLLYSIVYGLIEKGGAG